LNVYRTSRTFVPFAAVAASTVLAACHRSDSILLVEVAGDSTLHPAVLLVTVTAGTQTRSLQVPSAPGPEITWPASFSVELDPGLTGPVVVSVEATNATGLVIASGTTIQQNIDVGGQTIIAVALVSGTVPGVDAGAVDASGGGAGGGAGAAGGVGSVGAGGAGSGGGGAGGRGGAGGGAGGRGGSGGGGAGGRGGGGGGLGGRGGLGGGGVGGGGVGGGAGAALGGAGGKFDAGGDLARDLGVAFESAEAA